MQNEKRHTAKTIATSAKPDLRGIIQEVLREAAGAWVSGEELSQRLGISRAAVSKHMHALRDSGHGIEAVTRKGYRLICEPDSLASDIVRGGLRTTVFGQRDYLYLPSTASTNMEAMSLALRGAPEGTVVVADEQTQGRGRKGRTWHSPAGSGLYVSLVLRPNLEPEAAPVVTLLTNVVIAETIAALTGITPVCKWPNDVLIQGRKVAGNLTEVFLVADSVGHIVTGAGINVLPLPASEQATLRTPPISLTEAAREPFAAGKPDRHTGTSHATATVRHNAAIAESRVPETLPTEDIHNTSRAIIPPTRLALLRSFLEHYETWYGMLQQQGIAPVIARWKELTDVVGRHLHVETKSGIVEGIVTDVTEDGMLVLRRKGGAADGQEVRLFSGDIVDG